MTEYTREDAIADLLTPESVFAVREECVGGVTFRVLAHQWATLNELYARAERYADRTFLVYEEERLTFGEAQRRVANLASRLVRDFGVRKGDRVVLAMRNYPEWCLSYMAVTSIGAIIVPLNAWWQGEELAHGVIDTGARVSIVDPERLEWLQPHLDRQDVAMIVARATSRPAASTVEFSSLVEGEGVLPTIDVGADDDASVLYTSGLTKHPKGVVSTHRALVSAIFGRMAGYLVQVLPLVSEAERRRWIEWAHRGRDALETDILTQATLVGVPLFHVTGCCGQFLPAFISGNKLVLMHKWNPERALELIERERISAFQGVPSMSRDLTDSPDFALRDTSSLTSLGSGGAPSPAAQLEGIRRRFSGQVGTGYGMTETNAAGCMIGGADYFAKPTSVGPAWAPMVDLKIVDEQGRELGPGCEGEVCIKSVSNMRGYWGKPEETAKVLENGWMHTGDIGQLDDRGYLYITGRAKNIVIRGGENISCAEVESALYEHPSVKEAAAFGVPDERLGEALAATVVTRAGHDLSVPELVEHLSTRLAKFKVPERISVQQEPLPRIASGKFDVHALRSRLAAAGDGRTIVSTSSKGGSSAD